MYSALQIIKLTMVHPLTDKGITHNVHSSSIYCHKWYCGFDCNAVDVDLITYLYQRRKHYVSVCKNFLSSVYVVLT
jgi:hypothetical protein